MTSKELQELQTLRARAEAILTAVRARKLMGTWKPVATTACADADGFTDTMMMLAQTERSDQSKTTH